MEEEEARMRAEEDAKAAARRAEEEERRAKLEEVARKQREREEEIERKKVCLHPQSCRILGERVAAPLHHHETFTCCADCSMDPV